MSYSLSHVNMCTNTFHLEPKLINLNLKMPGHLVLPLITTNSTADENKNKALLCIL